jgi:hypothetical protein
MIKYDLFQPNLAAKNKETITIFFKRTYVKLNKKPKIFKLKKGS